MCVCTNQICVQNEGGRRSIWSCPPPTKDECIATRERGRDPQEMQNWKSFFLLVLWALMRCLDLDVFLQQPVVLLGQSFSLFAHRQCLMVGFL